MVYDVIVLGGGPAGITAAIYGKRAGLNILVLDESPKNGGQILTTYEVDNYPGLPKIGGMELGDKLREHADQLGAEFAVGRVSSIEKQDDTFLLKTRKVTYEAKTVIIATGAGHRSLGVPGEAEHMGMGVSYCATCDGAFYKDKVTAVVGGGNVALEDALFLARTSKQVYLIHRRDEFRGDKVLVDQVKATDNITLVLDSVVESIDGQMKVDSLSVKNVKTEEVSKLEVDGVFIAVGITPNTDKMQGLPEMDEAGYILAGEDAQTSIPGVFAAGDVRTKQLRQVITSASDGANAIFSVQRYLNSQKLHKN
ncbi:MAG: thioredoxin-disulfide reductase [Lachnospiraceae bacterium]|nr:thioredoxin-disulfide reductase [Lachnospiraceae bacterium]